MAENTRLIFSKIKETTESSDPNDLQKRAMKTYPSKQAKNNFGAVIEEAQREPVQLTKNGRPIGGIVNQDIFEQVLQTQQQAAQKKALAILKQMQAEAAQKPTLTRVELKQLLECDDEEIDALFGNEFFNQ